MQEAPLSTVSNKLRKRCQYTRNIFGVTMLCTLKFILHFFTVSTVKVYEAMEWHQSIHSFHELIARDFRWLISTFVNSFSISMFLFSGREVYAGVLGLKPSVKSWDKSMSQINSCSINTHYILIQVILKLYRPKLNHIHSPISSV